MADLMSLIPSYAKNEFQGIKHAAKPESYGKDKVNTWLQTFKSLGLTDNQCKAMVANMIYECGLKHNVKNENEFRGGGAPGTSGWNCGEGTVQFTFFIKNGKLGTKGNAIKNFNKESARHKTLPETWEGYQSGPHIVDLDLSDAALITIVFYKNVIQKTKSMNLVDIVAEFYLEKAGRGGSASKGKDSFGKAYYRAKDYCKTHAAQGKNSANQENGFLKALKTAFMLAGEKIDMTGYDPNAIVDYTTDSGSSRRGDTHKDWETPKNGGELKDYGYNSNNKTKGIIIGLHMKQK